MESSPQPTSESIKTEDQLVQTMADLNVADKSDTPKKEDEGSLANDILSQPALRPAKKRGKPMSPQVQPKPDTTGDVLEMPIVTLPDIDDTANKRPKLSSDKFEPDISLSTSPASSDQGNSNDQDDKDDASDYEDASDNNSLNEKMEKLELPIDNDDETESVDLPSMGSL